MTFFELFLISIIIILVFLVVFFSNQEPDKSQYITIEEYKSLEAIKIKLEQNLILSKMQIDQQEQERIELLRKNDEEIRKNREIGSKVISLTKVINDINVKLLEYEEKINNSNKDIGLSKEDVAILDNALNLYIEANPHEKNEVERILRTFQVFNHNPPASNDSLPNDEKENGNKENGNKEELSEIIDSIKKRNKTKNSS